MEALGAAASIVSLIDAALKVAEVIEKIRNAPDYVKALANEITDLRLVLESVQEAVNSLEDSSLQSRNDSLVNLKNILEKLRGHLTKLEECISRMIYRSEAPVDGGAYRILWHKRLLIEKETEKILRKIRDSRQNLVAILNATHLTQTIELRLSATAFVPIPSPISSESSVIDGLDVKDDRESIIAAPGMRTKTVARDVIVTGSLVADQCVSSCDCLCHRGSTLRTPLWMRYAIGLLFYNYSGKPLFLRCSDSRCRAAKTGSVRFNYVFPEWAFQRALHFSYSWSSLNGMDGQLALRVPRILSLDDINSIYAIFRTSTVQQLKSYMEKQRVQPFDLDDRGRSLAHTAAWAQNYEQYSWLVQKGADPHYEDDQGLSALNAWISLFLAQSDEERLSWKDRIDFSAWQEAIKRMGLPLLHRVVLGIAPRKFTLSDVLESPVNINHRDCYGRTALFWSCVRGNLQHLQELLDHGADPLLPDAQRYSPLHWSAWNGSKECIRVLLQAGVDPNETSMDYRTALHVAAQCNTDRTAEIGILLEFDATIEAADLQGKTPLHRAAERGKTAHIGLLVHDGANIESRNHHGLTPLISAVTYNRIDNVDALLDLGAKYYVIDTAGANILHHVALWAGEEIMALLRSLHMSHVDPDAQDTSGHTPIACFMELREKYFGSQHIRDVDEELEHFKLLLASVQSESEAEAGPDAFHKHQRNEEVEKSPGRTDSETLKKIPGSWNFAE